MMLRLVLLICWLAAGVPLYGFQDRSPGWGHRQMIALLQQIKDNAPQQNLYMGDGRARQLRGQLETLSASAPPMGKAELHFTLGDAEIWLGNEREAIKHYEAALALVPGGFNGPHRSKVFDLRLRLGVAWLRLGETARAITLERSRLNLFWSRPYGELGEHRNRFQQVR